MLLSGLIVVGLFRWMHLNVLNDARFYDPDKAVERSQRAWKALDARQLPISHRFTLPDVHRRHCHRIQYRH